jgi:hypothetical protein
MSKLEGSGKYTYRKRQSSLSAGGSAGLLNKRSLRAATAKGNICTHAGGRFVVIWRAVEVNGTGGSHRSAPVAGWPIRW